MGQTLVVVPCGQAKVWGKQPGIGPVEARLAYTGSPFTVNRGYAERFADRWVILSAKYGFITPEFVIPGPYNVTFKRKRSGPVDVGTLREQVEEQGLNEFAPIIVLGGRDYQRAVRAAFESWPVRLLAPFAGLPLGKSMQAAKRAIAAEDPLLGIDEIREIP